MKNLIIGAFTGYNFKQLKPWVLSIDECGFDGDKVLIVGETDQETIDYLNRCGFKLVFMDKNHLKDMPIHVLRFVYIYDFLKQFYQNYNYVVTTDVKDVYFQKNPFEFIKNQPYKLVVGSEGLAYENEPWGNQNLYETFGPYIYNDFKAQTIYNVGVLCGDSRYIRDLCLNIYLSAINRPIPIVDQAVFNVLIQTEPYISCTNYTTHDDGFICHAGTTADPTKIESFRSLLLEAEPIFEGGVVKVADSKETFYIVHQYDRVPEWKTHVFKKFNEIEEKSSC